MKHSLKHQQLNSPVMSGQILTTHQATSTWNLADKISEVMWKVFFCSSVLMQNNVINSLNI